jgi:hypothetical protein
VPHEYWADDDDPWTIWWMHARGPDADEFERLIEVTDRDLLGWITGEIETPQNYDTPLFQRLKAASFGLETIPLALSRTEARACLN